ncbi:MAG TPA: ATP-binding protein [Bacteroidaceae bacterium]|nr:ATP-binding protein [Bacteroidaceae bacterium]
MSRCLFQDLKLLFFRECSLFHRHNYNTLLQILNYNYVRNLKGPFQMGPSGVNKTHIAGGLCSDALKKGYKAYFRTMEQIMEMLKLKDITRSAGTEYKRLLKAHLLVIDDIMLFALDKQQAVALFNFINHLHEKASFIVTTNKSPEEWVQLLDDEVIATALLDRILYHCEVIRLSGKSYRMQNRKTIFEKN